jgi:low temperature requirement protein LtrA
MGSGSVRAGEERVTPLELFFDLIFVLSFTQVTLKMAQHASWAGLGEGLLILAAVWWAWAAYGWLTNSIDPDENLNRVSMFAAMGGMLVVSLSIPDAFGDRGVLFGCATSSCARCSWSSTYGTLRAPRKRVICRRFSS